MCVALKPFSIYLTKSKKNTHCKPTRFNIMVNHNLLLHLLRTSVKVTLTYIYELKYYMIQIQSD